MRKARSKADTIDKEAPQEPEAPLSTLRSITSDLGLQVSDF